MKYKINKAAECQDPLNLCTRLSEKITANGNEQVSPDEDSCFVLNIFDLEAPSAYRRKRQEEMVVSVALSKELLTEPKTLCYGALIRSISNLLFCISGLNGKDNPVVYCVTPEAGFSEFGFDPGMIYKKMYPVISSHFVLRNRLSDDLRLMENKLIPEIEELKVFGGELRKLGVLPSPFPLTEFLTKDLIDQLYRLYQIKGLSYGNLSIRNTSYETEETAFWMTARGVDKSNLRGIGKDILLVKGYDNATGEMLVSVPVDHDPRIRVSVDAIEHYLIYSEFPRIGAIIHVHAWIDDVLCTTQAYPCGTSELAENVVELLKMTSCPERTEVGLKNHGLTITGPDISDIFQRLPGRLKINVPMQN